MGHKSSVPVQEASLSERLEQLEHSSRPREKIKGSGQKQVPVYLVRLGLKTGTFQNHVKSALYQVPIFGRMKPRYTRVCLLCLTFKCFFVVFQPIRGPPSFDPMPPIRMPTYGETPSTLHTPHHAIRATHVCAHTPPPRYIDTTYGYYPRSFARPPRSRQIPVLLVWRGVGGWRGSPRTSAFV